MDGALTPLARMQQLLLAERQELLNELGISDMPLPCRPKARKPRAVSAAAPARASSRLLSLPTVSYREVIYGNGGGDEAAQGAVSLRARAVDAVQGAAAPSDGGGWGGRQALGPLGGRKRALVVAEEGMFFG